MNTNMHVTRAQAQTMLTAVVHTLGRTPATSNLYQDLRVAEQMLLAALARIRDAEYRRDKKGVWAK